jgi:hypothetical protein
VSYDAPPRVWDPITLEPLVEFKGHTGGVNGACLSPDGLRVATASADRTARIWDAVTGETLLVLRGHTDAVWRVFFSFDGNLVATTSRDRTVRVWEAHTGLPRLELRGHKSVVNSAYFNVDCSHLICRDEGKETIVWDLATGKPAVNGDQTMPKPSGPGPAGRWLPLLFGNNMRIIDLTVIPPGDELIRRQWFTRPEPDWHAAELQKLTSAKDIRGAAFHLDRLLAYRPHQRMALLAQRAELLAAEPLILARTRVHSPGVFADRPQDHAVVVFLAGQQDQLALRILGGLLIRTGRPQAAMAPLINAIKRRAPDRPPVEELLLAIACADQKRIEDARRWLDEAARWLEQYRLPFQVASTVAGFPAGPLCGLAELHKPPPDPRYDPFDWETWHEIDVFRRVAEHKLLPTQ